MTASHDQQIDSMSLAVAERTLRQYGQYKLADDIVEVASAIARGVIPRQNNWPCKKGGE